MTANLIAVTAVVIGVVVLAASPVSRGIIVGVVRSWRRRKEGRVTLSRGPEEEKRMEAIAAAVQRYHEVADGESKSVKGAAADVLVERIEQALAGIDWREAEA